MNLRPYQQACYDAVLSAHENVRSTLVVMPTGSGKTIAFAHLAKYYLAKGRVMVLAHRAELLAQASEKLEAITGSKPDLEMADWRSAESSLLKAPIVVSTVQTQTAGKYGGRMTRFHAHEFSLLILDEAHHGIAPSWKRCIDYYTKDNGCKVLGVTATPDRADETALGNIFDTVAYKYDILDAIDDGWLVPIHQKFVPIKSINLSRVGTVAGDLNARELSEQMEKREALCGVCDAALKTCGERRTLVYVASVKQAEWTAEILNAGKPRSARWVCGATPTEERNEIIRGFRDGDYQFLVNVGVATEGFDVPDCEVIVCARPTKSRSLYAQMLGRAMRPVSGLVDSFDDKESRRTAILSSRKPYMLALDFVMNSGRHKLISAADILAGKRLPDVIHRAIRKTQKSDEEIDVQTAIEEGQREYDEQQRYKASRIVGTAEFELIDVSPFDHTFGLPERRRSGPRDSGRAASDAQVALLKKFKIADADKLSRAAASAAIGECIRRSQSGLCTFNQAKLLRKYGYDPKDIAFDAAKILIDRIAANGWRRPS